MYLLIPHCASIFQTNHHSRSFFITTVISPCMPMYSLTCVQKGYMVIDPVDRH